ncbi:MAG TPA: LamG-like jellyroll fold domain-containing protein [Candidatus Limnocylindrales bacterium]|nr:LamG-like jellyroll fold domain-containing protein [Candidatus Limnocylindrales bacterium]
MPRKVKAIAVPAERVRGSGMVHSGNGLRVAGSALALLVIGTLAIHGSRPAVAAAKPCQSSQRDARAAAAMASACGQVVEDMSGRSPTSRVLARPDGSRELVEYAQPRWVRRADGSWAEADTTLRRTGAAVAPAATVVAMAFSAGGDDRLARLADGDRTLAMTWATTLPTPVISGDTATYSNVLPEVDLRLTATPTGFEEVLVVKTRKAADNPSLSAVRLGLSTAGLSVSAAEGGGLQARDANGRVVFASPPPMMWDSSGVGTEGPGGLPRYAAMGEGLDAGGVVVVPDQAFLTDPKTRYPVFLDPSWSGFISGNVWKVVASRSDVANSSTFTLNNGATRGDAGAGRTCDNFSGNTCLSTQYLVRSLFRMDINGARGKHILAASFNITQKWSWTCSPASQAKIWATGAISSSTSWNTQPGWNDGLTATANASHRAGGGFSCSDTGTVSFNAKTIIDTAYANGWADITLGLRAVDETTVSQWKRFDHNTASLSIVYNTVPNVPDTLTTHSQACATGAGRPVVAVANPVLSARVTDPDGAGEGDIGGTLRGEFAWERFDTATSTWTAAGSAAGTPQAGGTTIPFPAPILATGAVYRWRARANDSWSYGGSSGTDSSGWSGWCEFEVDSAAPSAPRLTPDAGNQPFVAGKTIRLALAPGDTPADADVTGYSWWVVDGAGTHATTFTAGATASIDWTPIAGQGTVHIKAKDRIQLSAETTYVFNAAQAATEVARWPLDDPTGSTTVADSTGHGYSAISALSGSSTLGAPGRVVGGSTVLSLDGASTNSITASGAVVNATKSFTVSAWAKLGAKTSDLVVVSQPGFNLEYAAGVGEDRWELVTVDTAGSVTGRARSTTVPLVGVWTHITGGYDSATRTLQIYVNGVRQGTAIAAANVNAAGPFRIGRGSAQYFAGGIADVRVWDRVLSASEVAAMSDPLTDNVGQWRMDEGSGPMAFDSSNFFHDVNLNLTSGVSWTTESQSGAAALAFDRSGDALTDGPVLNTDQSFTVSAWVRLADEDTTDAGPTLPNGNRTALGQSGNRVSGFYLGYRVDGAGVPHWGFAIPETDIEGGNDPNAPGYWVSALSTNPVTTADVNRWAHLVGVYDATTGAMRLYVNGTLAASATRTDPRWNVTGPLTVGSALWSAPGGLPTLVDRWKGSIDTVHVYQGAVAAGSIASIP